MAFFGTDRLINQFFAVGAARHVKSIHGSDVKVYAWEAGDVFSLVGMFGPEYMGGKGDVSKKIEEEVQRTGKPYKEVAFSVCNSFIHLRASL